MRLESEDFFKEQLLRLFERLSLSCNIKTLARGDAPVICYGGRLSLSEDGEIKREDI